MYGEKRLLCPYFPNDVSGVVMNYIDEPFKVTDWFVYSTYVLINAKPVMQENDTLRFHGMDSNQFTRWCNDTNLNIILNEIEVKMLSYLGMNMEIFQDHIKMKVQYLSSRYDMIEQMMIVMKELNYKFYTWLAYSGFNLTTESHLSIGEFEIGRYGEVFIPESPIRYGGWLPERKIQTKAANIIGRWYKARSARNKIKTHI
jgi:hypothetical protein